MCVFLASEFLSCFFLLRTTPITYLFLFQVVPRSVAAVEAEDVKKEEPIGSVHEEGK